LCDGDVVLPRTLESERRRDVRDVETLTEVEVEQTPELAPLPEATPILSTTGTRAALESLAARVDALEVAVRELSFVVKELARRPQSRGL
jgi:hypothetical protein